MLSASNYSLFLLASLALLLSPGPAVIYIVTRSLHQGRSAGLVSALGLGLGNFIQALAATAGLSVVLVSSSLVFNAIKAVGAVYLIYLGIRTLGARKTRQERAPEWSLSNKKVFRESLLVNIFNPKVAIFFLAFLPQFIEPTRGNASLQILILGASFSALGVLTDSLYALLSGTLGARLNQSDGFQRSLGMVSGLVYIGLGIGALLYRGGSPG